VVRRPRRFRLGIALVVVTLMVVAGVAAEYLSSFPKGISTSNSKSGSTSSSRLSSAISETDMPAVQLELAAGFSGTQFAGAVGGGGYLYAGLLNGRVEKLVPQDGLVLASVALPDRNSAAHLLYYNGSLYVGTEFLRGAANTPPYHIYRIDPRTMQIVRQVAMNPNDANGFVSAYNGYLWAGDGGCTLYKINPSTLSVIKTVPHVAEDEMTFDGTYYWTECTSAVNVLKPDSTLTFVATGALSFPGRPRGFYEIGSSVYSVDSANSTIYRMSISHTHVVFKNMGTLGNHCLETRDTFSTNGILYTYQTKDDALVQARILVYEGNFSLEAAVTLPGSGLPTDASEHSMFLFDGMIYFVTTSFIGYFVPLDAQTL
jgi:hypothetical protein